MSTAIFWGDTTDNIKPLVLGDSQDLPFEEMIFDLVNGLKRKEGYLYGLPDPFMLVKDYRDGMTVNDVAREGFPKTIFPTLMFFTEAYDPSTQQFLLGDVNAFAKTVGCCSGFYNQKKKIRVRLEEGIWKQFSALKKEEVNKFILCKLKHFTINHVLKVGGLAQAVQDRIGPFIIQGYDHNILLVSDKAMLSCRDYIRHVDISREGEKKVMGYNIDEGFVYALQQWADNNKSSITEAFKQALFNDI